MIFAMAGTELSFFAIPDTTNPNPRKTTNAIAESISIFTNVAKPFTRVNPKNNAPIAIMMIELIIEKVSLLRHSPIMMFIFLTGVAKNLLITSV